MAKTAGDGGRWEIIGKKGTWQVRHINPYSDGDPSKWPGLPQYRPSSEERYLFQLARAWVKKDGVGQPGVEYYLDQLPRGYALFETDQLTGSAIYKRLFGHPSGRFYDSIPRFEVHFLWLMSGGQGVCQCVLCGNPGPRTAIPRNRVGLATSEVYAIPQERRRVLAEPGSNPSSRSTSTHGRGPGGTSSRPQRQSKAAGEPYARDAEGNEDVYKDYIKTLESRKGGRRGIEIDIREIDSLDWRAEHEWDGFGKDLVQQTLTVIDHQHSFVPRVGELVLWTPHFMDGHYLMLDTDKSEFKFYSFEQKCFHGFPPWRAGVVAAVPSATATDGAVDFPDIQNLPEKRTALNTAGFRVETFPDPNNEVDKKASKQYRYVPLRNIRPLSHWQILLQGVPREGWHPSIEHALTCMTSISLYEKWRFNGEWPHAFIQCKGIYIGSELIVVGDTVRITPEPTARKKKKTCTDVIIVDSIRLNLNNARPEDVLPDTPTLSPTSSISVVGRAYTLDIRRHYEMQGTDPNAVQIELPSPVGREGVKTRFRPVGTGDYGSWYHLHEPSKSYEISYDRVLGRLYEAAAVRLWTGQLQTHHSEGGQLLATTPSLDFDLSAIEQGRRYATQTDERLEEPTGDETAWFWADTRAEALDIETLNGIPVGRYDDLRDKETLEQWRAMMKVLNGQPTTTDFSQFKFVSKLPGGRVGRKPGSKVVNGKVIQPDAEGFDEAVSDDHEDEDNLPSTPKHKVSQLASAALVSSDEYDEDDDDVDDFQDAVEEMVPTVESETMSSTMPQQAQPPQSKMPRTKAEIMENVDEYGSDDEEDWFNQPPVIRGGTEESEGGDYNPYREDDA